MSERISDAEPTSNYQRKAYLNDRPGIASVPSEQLLKRQLQAKQSRAQTLEKIRAAQALKASLPVSESVPSGSHAEIAANAVENIIKEVILPVTAYREQIIDMINNNKASVIISETGGGKSTQIPQYAIDAGYVHVFVAQGRKGMTDSLADRIQDEMNARLGTEEAYGLVNSIHGGRTRRFENARFTIATAASLTFMMADIEKEYGDDPVLFIADEIHEDDPHVELAVGVIGSSVSKKEKWRTVAMSATIDPVPLKIPLGRITNFANPEQVDVPVLTIEGRPFTIEIHEDSKHNPAEGFVANGADHRRAILGTRGMNQLERIKEEVIAGYEARQPGSSANLIFKKYSGKTSPLQREEISRISRELPDDMQLVILATPAARSGVTIPGVTYVGMDGMINREKRQIDGGRGIIGEYIAQSEIIQFAGRAGRDVPGGVAYLNKPMPSRQGDDEKKTFAKIYPFKSIAERPEYPLAAIFNSNLAELILNAATVGKLPNEINKFIINEQDGPVLRQAVSRLRREFGALDDDDRITETGGLMSRFPVAPELARGMAEGMLQGRSRQQLARMAVIAAAIDAGGLQMTSKRADNALWNGLLSAGAVDDFSAQLDFSLAVREASRAGGSSKEGFTFAYLNDLDYGRIMSTDEPTEKMFRRLGINPEIFELEPPTQAELQQMRDDFTAGMYNLTFTHFKKPHDLKDYFKRVRGSDNYPELTLAKQSVIQPNKGELVAGMHQFYETIRGDKLELFDILGATLRVDPEVVARNAIANRLVEYVEVPGTSRINGGIVVESEQGMFGNLKVGAHRVVKSREFVPKESQHRLVETVQNKPGPELRDLRAVATELAEYRRLMPKDILDGYRRPSAPVDLTETEISRLLRHYAERTRDAQELDRLIGNHAYENNIVIDMYYDAVAREEILRRSPSTIEIAGAEVEIHYDGGKPYVTRLTEAQLANITGPIYIDEAFSNKREVLHQIKKEGGRGTRRVSFGTY
ncbi:MAG: uncharacterized protein JWO54_112 [Candidatus Saccharibacteria bacterium]|nr:uncharacterized protein [Candidatus Saccharibacteria bacterium]MDB5180354.1 uncharacterized protein [Candidatus Saccharibacteria bacterium]